MPNIADFYALARVWAQGTERLASTIGILAEHQDVLTKLNPSRLFKSSPTYSFVFPYIFSLVLLTSTCKRQPFRHLLDWQSVIWNWHGRKPSGRRRNIVFLHPHSGKLHTVRFQRSSRSAPPRAHLCRKCNQNALPMRLETPGLWSHKLDPWQNMQAGMSFSGSPFIKGCSCIHRPSGP